MNQRVLLSVSETFNVKKKDEREFLKLAGVYLACRWQVMGHVVEDFVVIGDPKIVLHYAILGMVDYEEEMKLSFK